jgi:hypothetical protein
MRINNAVLLWAMAIAIGVGQPTMASEMTAAIVQLDAGLLPARLAPPGQVGAVTGGVLSFVQIGALASPAVFSLLLRLSGGYSAGWVACAVPAILVGVNMLRQGKPAR